MTDEDYNAGLQLAIRAAREDFETYVELFNPPETEFVFSKFHRFLAKLVQEVADGKRGRRQSISVPPQMGKSTMLTIEGVSWALGRFPGIHVAITGFSNDLVTDFSKMIKDRISHPLYRLVFPDCSLVDGSNRMDAWKLSNESELIARSIGTKLTGRRVDWLIVDDPHAGREEAERESDRRRVQQWYTADCMSRLSPDAKVFLIGTRWHQQDLIGYLTHPDRVAELREREAESEIFEVTNLPAICEDEDNDPLGRSNGDALFPEVRGIQFLKAIKAAILPYEWISQYQGSPRTSVMGNFEKENLHFIAPDEVPEGLELVRGWDLAITEKQTSDYSVGCLFGYDVDLDHLYIVDIFRVKKMWTKLRPLMIDLAFSDKQNHRVQRIGIESVAGFGAIFQEIRQALLGEVKVEPRLPPRGGKLLRAQPWLNKIEAKKVFVVRGRWNAELIAELESFPSGSHDDQIDAISTAWEMLTGRNRNGGRPGIPQRPSITVRARGTPRPWL